MPVAGTVCELQRKETIECPPLMLSVAGEMRYWQGLLSCSQLSRLIRCGARPQANWICPTFINSGSPLPGKHTRAYSLFTLNQGEASGTGLWKHGGPPQAPFGRSPGSLRGAGCSDFSWSGTYSSVVSDAYLGTGHKNTKLGWRRRQRDFGAAESTSPQGS